MLTALKSALGDGSQDWSSLLVPSFASAFLLLFHCVSFLEMERRPRDNSRRRDTSRVLRYNVGMTQSQL